MSRLLRALIRRFDAFLCRIYGVYEFTEDKDCILRLCRTTVHHPVSLPGISVHPGDAVVEIHLWNEHISPLSAAKPSMVWASRTLRQMRYSLHLVAGQVQHDPRLEDVRALCGITSVLSSEHNPNRPDLMERLGFTSLPCYNALGAFGEFWENFYAWGIMWTYNPLSLRSRRLLTTRRTEIWMSIDELISRYTSPNDHFQ
jgi:hypothetical protein